MTNLLVSPLSALKKDEGRLLISGKVNAKIIRVAFKLSYTSGKEISSGDGGV